MTKTIEKLVLAMAFAGLMGAAFGMAFAVAATTTAKIRTDAEGAE